MKRSTSLKRTGFKKPEPSKAFKTSFATKTVLRAKALKTRKKRVTVAEGAKYLAACRGEPCFLRVEGICCGDRETVVPCHSNQSQHGKGMGLKAKHEFTVPGCFACHSWLDQSGQPRDVKFMYWQDAYDAWEMVRARKMGIELQEAE